MKIIFLPVLISTILLSNDVTQQFQGIVEQQNDYSCGTATIATLIQGLYGTEITEQEVVDIILKDKNETTVKEIKEKGYSLLNLQNGSTSLGYKAMWKKIAPQHLPMIDQPVIILIGLKSEFPHFVVLKGVRNGEAYLADPIRGNVRINYDKLIEEGISEKYPSWYVMATQAPKSKIWNQHSTLALSDNKEERIKTHVTDAQANIRNMLSLSKKEQLSFSIGYTRDISKSNIQELELNEVRDNYKFGATYGITNNTEAEASFDTSKSVISNNLNSHKLKTDSIQGYNLRLTYRDTFDSSNTMGAIYGLNGRYVKDYKLLNTSLSATVYNNIDGISLIGGGAINKSFSNDEAIDNTLEDYTIGLNLGLIKPFANRYSASFIGSYQFDGGKKENSSDIYTLKSSLSWIYDKHIQVEPNAGVSFNDNYSKPNYSFGINLIYFGGW